MSPRLVADPWAELLASMVGVRAGSNCRTPHTAYGPVGINTLVNLQFNPLRVKTSVSWRFVVAETENVNVSVDSKEL